jgi:glutathione reductase (NADPH)
MTKQYDLAVIGTGPAASTVAEKIAKQGKKVAIIEQREFGGTCALRGCNPKKVLTTAAELVARMGAFSGKYISAETSDNNWSGLIKFKSEFTDHIPKSSRKSYEEKGIDTFSGTARFLDSNTIACGQSEIQCKKIFVGTGARPAPLKIPGGQHLITSDQFLEMSTLPKRMVFIGGGFIAMEFAHVAALFGCKATILQDQPHILDGFDPDLASQLMRWSIDRGIDIKTGARAKSIDGKQEEFIVEFEQDNKTGHIQCDQVVHAAGRVPNIDDLNLEKANVDSNEKGIAVDLFMRSTTNPDVFAAGDCAASGRPKLTPVANEEARVVVNNLFLDEYSEQLASPDASVIPSVAFTIPPIAAVGMSANEIDESNKQVEVHHQDTSDWNSNKKYGIQCAGHKILIDTDSNRILGAHLLGPGADETINLFALAIKFSLTASQLKSSLFVFPTFASDVRKML